MLWLNIIQELRLYQFDFDYLAWFGLQGQLHNNLLAKCIYILYIYTIVREDKIQSVDSGAHAVLTNLLFSIAMLYVHIILLFHNMYKSIHTVCCKHLCHPFMEKETHAYCGIRISKHLRMLYGLVNRHCLAREDQNSGNK